MVMVYAPAMLWDQVTAHVNCPHATRVTSLTDLHVCPAELASRQVLNVRRAGKSCGAMTAALGGTKVFTGFVRRIGPNIKFGDRQC